MGTPKDSFQKLIDVVRDHADSSGHEMLSLSSELMQDYVEELDSSDQDALTKAKENILKWKDHVLVFLKDPQKFGSSNLIKCMPEELHENMRYLCADELTPEEEKELDAISSVAKEDEEDIKEEAVTNNQANIVPVSDDWQDEKATIDFGGTENEFKVEMSEEDDQWAAEANFEEIVAKEADFNSGSDSLLVLLGKELIAENVKFKQLNALVDGKAAKDVLTEKCMDIKTSIDRIGEASADEGFEGLHLFCDFLGSNLSLLSESTQAAHRQCASLFEKLTTKMLAHLNEPENDELCFDVISLMENMAWPQPLTYREEKVLLYALINQLHISGDEVSEDTIMEVTDEHVSLAMSEDYFQQLQTLRQEIHSP